MAYSTISAGARVDLDVLLVLPRGQHLLEHVAELVFPPGAAGLDIRQGALEVAHAIGQRLHLAQPLVDLLQPLGDLLERLAEARLQGLLQLFLDHLLHLLEAFVVLGLQCFQAFLHPLTQPVGLLELVAAEFVQLGGQLALELGEALGPFLPAGLCVTGQRLAQGGKPVTEFLAGEGGIGARFLAGQGRLVAQRFFQQLLVLGEQRLGAAGKALRQLLVRARRGPQPARPDPLKSWRPMRINAAKATINSIFDPPGKILCQCAENPL